MVQIAVQEVPEQIGVLTTLRSFSEVMGLLQAGMAVHLMFARDDRRSRFHLGETVRIYGVSTDEGSILGCNNRVNLAWVSCASLALWKAAAGFHPEPEWPADHKYLALSVCDLVIVDEVYSPEGGWSGWAAGELWAHRGGHQCVFPLAVAERFVLVTEPLLLDAHAAKGPSVCNGGSMVLWRMVPDVPRVEHLSGVVPPPPPTLPDHDAVGRALLGEDQACGVAHSDVVWLEPGTGAALHVGSEDAAFEIAFLRRSKILRVANCTGNIPNFHKGEADLLYYRFNVSRCRSRLDEDTAREFVDMLRFVSD